MSSKEDAQQEAADRFYWSHGPCCAGCNWWTRANSAVGECRRSAPVSGAERLVMLGMKFCSLLPGAGHVMTPRSHMCGEFRDDFDWATLPAAYRRRIGWKQTFSER